MSASPFPLPTVVGTWPSSLGVFPRSSLRPHDLHLMLVSRVCLARRGWAFPSLS